MTAGYLYETPPSAPGGLMPIFPSPSDLYSPWSTPWKQYVITTDVAVTFSSLANQWREETEHMSSVSEIVKHPAYERIVELGEAVVPLVLAELRDRPALWFEALCRLTGANPTAQLKGASTRDRVEAWLAWGRSADLIP